MRAAVRTLTLNMYAIEAPAVQAHLAGPASAYFSDLGAHMTDRCQVGFNPIGWVEEAGLKCKRERGGRK